MSNNYINPILRQEFSKDNPELTFDCLNSFNQQIPETIPSHLNEYLRYVALTGDTIFPSWSLFKKLIKIKFKENICELYTLQPIIPVYPNSQFDMEVTQARILKRLDTMTEIPFTIQRMCELLVHPTRFYSQYDKYMRGFEKCMYN